MFCDLARDFDNEGKLGYDEENIWQRHLEMVHDLLI